MAALDLTQSLNLDEIVYDWVWQMFEISKSGEEKKLKKDHINVDLNWSRVTVLHDKATYDHEDVYERPRTSNLFKTTFTNMTECKQEYTLSAERTTRSACELEITKGVTTEMEFGLTISVPGSVFEANAGFKREIEVTKSRRQTTEEELTWGVNTSIVVSPMSKAFAELEVSEKEMKSDFTVHSTMVGSVQASLYNLRDNNSFIKYMEGSIVNIVSKALRIDPKTGLCDSNRDIYVRDNMLHIITRGRTMFRFASEQNVKIHQEPITAR